MPGDGEFVKQKNILTYFAELAKLPDGARVGEAYEWLCEVAHPNVLGNGRYYEGAPNLEPFTRRVQKLARKAEGAATWVIRQETLFALGWSCVHMGNSFQLCQEAIKLVVERWPTSPPLGSG